MLYKHEDFEETLVHQCDNVQRFTMAHRREIANVRRHDVSAYLSVPIRNYKARKDEGGNYPIIGHEQVAIDFCPYCGCNLDTDKISSKPLKIKLL